jgi:hypothetical protein
MAIGSVLAAAKPVVQGALTALPGVAKVAGGFLGGPVGSALGGLAGQYVAGRIDPAMKAQRTQQAKDIAALQAGKLGLSEAEKRTMLAGAARGLQAQTAGMEANLRRQAAAQGGFGRSGAQQQALGQLAAQRGEQIAQYAGEVDDLSQRTAERRKAEIMNRFEMRRREALQAGAEAGAALAQAPSAIGVAKKKVELAEKAAQGDESAQLTAAIEAATKRLAELKGGQ